MTSATLILESHIRGRCIQTYEVWYNGRMEYRTWNTDGSMKVLTWTVADAYAAHEMMEREAERLVEEMER